MRWKLVVCAALCVAVTAAVFALPARSQEEPPRITKEDARALLDDPNTVILDARITADWRGSDRKIKGAVRVEPLDIGTWIGNYRKDQKLVVYCA